MFLNREQMIAGIYAGGRPPRTVARWQGKTVLILESKTYEHIQKQVASEAGK